MTKPEVGRLPRAIESVFHSTSRTSTLASRAAFRIIFGSMVSLQPSFMRVWLADRAFFPAVGRYFTEEWVVHLFSYGVLFIDLGVTGEAPLAWSAVAAFHIA